MATTAAKADNGHINTTHKLTAPPRSSRRCVRRIALNAANARRGSLPRSSRRRVRRDVVLNAAAETRAASRWPVVLLWPALVTAGRVLLVHALIITNARAEAERIGTGR